jgi:hypothetical protein
MFLSAAALVSTPGSLLARRAKMALGRAVALRVAAHLAAWAPFIVAAVRLVQDGWRPVSDAAAIALRSWDVLTAHGPLVGQATRLAHGVYDPGPLQYWLLALPVHLDPPHGLVWGAVLWCMLAASLMIEAAWSVAAETGAVLASGMILATVAWMPGVALQPYWNPWFGVMFLFAALAAGWAVMSGRRGWWPVLVITASVAAQAHLMFGVVSGALLLVALVVGLADSARDRAGYRWAVVGLVAGAACWAAPVVQELTGRTGNLTALIHSEATAGHQTGLAFGLKALAGAAEPPPLWWTPLQSLLNLHVIERRSAWFGAVTLAVTAAVLVAAIRPLRSRRLAALAAVSLVASLGSLVMYAGIAEASIPATPSSLNTVNYLMILMLPVGILSWLTVAAALVLTGKRVLSRVRAPAASPEDRGTEDRGGEPAAVATGTAARWAVSVVAFAALAVLALVSSLTVLQDGRQFPAVADRQVVRAVDTASRQIQQQLPPQPIALSVVSPDVHYRQRRLLLGLAWVLRTRGYRAEIAGFGWELGRPYILRGQPRAHVRVLVNGTSVSADVTGPAPAGTGT